MAKKGPKSMTAEHKEALAAGRTESKAVKDYLNALEANRPKRGRRRTPESIERRLAALTEQIPESEPFQRLSLIQERVDLERELAALTSGSGVDVSELEKGFVKVARSYAERKGISYAAWREVGVPAATLKAAGITRAL